MKPSRVVSILSMVFILAACGGAPAKSKGPRTASYGDPNAPQSPTAGAQAAGQSPAPGTNTGGSKTAAAPKRTTGGTTQTSAPTEGKINDFGGYGFRGSGKWIMTPQPYTNIVVEAGYVDGRKPNQAALEYLVSTLRDVTGKNVSLGPVHRIQPGSGAYDGDDIVEISRTTRKTLSEKPTISIWVGYLNGTLKGGGAAGVAVAGTVTAVFLDTINDLPFPPTTKLAIEKTILLQEVGHIIGLVNIGYKSPRDHEDPGHPGHSKNTKSVMYWALMTREALIDFLANGAAPPDKFDADDLADLRDMASGKFG